MKLIKSSFEILGQKPGLEGIYKAIEVAGRTCYKSLDKITEDSAEEFVNRMINSKHYAMLEHGTVYLKIRKGTYAYSHYVVVCEPDDDFMSSSRELSYRPYTKVNILDDYIYVTTNYRHIVENGWLDDLEYLCEPTEFHEKRVTVRFTTSNGIMREFTRHRSHSFAVESTRYCNYSKDKFNNEITFIVPYWYTNPEKDIRSRMLEISLSDAESSYLSLIKEGAKPQEAREVLPLATKCDMIMTGFVSDWGNFFNLRVRGTTGAPHPDAKALAEPLMYEFEKRKLI